MTGIRVEHDWHFSPRPVDLVEIVNQQSLTLPPALGVLRSRFLPRPDAGQGDARDSRLTAAQGFFSPSVPPILAPGVLIASMAASEK